ncbi:MAG: SURF1 family protein [Gammaproteobacteria bacterium]|nr:SURF1 family protein [Gammaproteobacteria bacterium]
MSILHKTLFTLNIGKRTFSPDVIPTVITLCVLYFLISLGLWQLERADYKQDLQTKIETRQHLQPIDIGNAPDNQDDRIYLPVSITGQYDASHHILLDNQVVNMKAGYDVYTPFKLSNGHSILINRGWVVQGNTRQDMPKIKTPANTVTLTGLLSMPPSPPGVILSEQTNNYSISPTIVQLIDINVIEKSLGYKISPMIVILDEKYDTEFYRKPVKLNMKSAKHTGYAVQWFTLATVLLLIYLVTNTRKNKKANE